MSEIKPEVVESLRNVYDPEIPINVYDLGLIYEITVREDHSVHVLMTLTSPTCPTGEYIQAMVQEAVEQVNGVNAVEVEMTFDPPWSPDKVNDAVKEDLGLESEESSSIGVDQTFADTKPMVTPIPDSTCFNCGASSEVYPLIPCHYQGEQRHICTGCITKFQ